MALPDSLAIFSLEGRRALVTGASSGIGRHMACVLAGAGASVVLVARQRQRLEEAAAGIAARGGRAHTLAADLVAETDLSALAANAALPFGAPDILVNAAGVNFREPVEAVTRRSWDATLALNLSVPFFLARELMPGMRQRGAGNIINIASLQSFRAFANSAPYGASKGGIVQLTRAMAEAWSSQGVVANAIAPGFFPTELTATIFADRELHAHHAGMTAVGRNGVLADLDGATIFLASGAARYVTGQVLHVDGGYTAK
jgi:NAD(P)-dependent dehydrogenase (short-subunit alcohol dehydrogenase family)